MPQGLLTLSRTDRKVQEWLARHRSPASVLHMDAAEEAHCVVMGSLRGCKGLGVG
jgi:hypothetical protein